MDANGDFVVAYQVLNTSTYLYGISAQRFNLAGTAQGSTIVLNDGSSQQCRRARLPKVAMDSAGDFVIAYQGYDSNQPRCLCPAVQFVRRGPGFDLPGEHAPDG